MIRTVQALEERLQHIRTPMSLSVLGCVVNGPGEARETDIGITGGGNGKHMVYLSGVTDHHVQDADMIEHIVKLVEAKAAEIEARGPGARRREGDRAGLCWRRVPALALAADRRPYPEARPFGHPDRAQRDVAAALARAQPPTSHRVILVFGANWCHDSRALAGWFATPRFAAMLAAEL